MTQFVDCFCCRESSPVLHMLTPGVQYITQHPEFEDVCLKRHILVLFLRLYRDLRGGETDEHWKRWGSKLRGGSHNYHDASSVMIRANVLACF